ncbi:MAG TPA: hypothetical protein VJ743_16350, partial [Albitalea sp.]|nr:hypothetical protein [Albitalea sp.]
DQRVHAAQHQTIDDLLDEDVHLSGLLGSLWSTARFKHARPRGLEPNSWPLRMAHGRSLERLLLLAKSPPLQGCAAGWSRDDKGRRAGGILGAAPLRRHAEFSLAFPMNSPKKRCFSLFSSLRR